MTFYILSTHLFSRVVFITIYQYAALTCPMETVVFFLRWEQNFHINLNFRAV